MDHNTYYIERIRAADHEIVSAEKVAKEQYDSSPGIEVTGQWHYHFDWEVAHELNEFSHIKLIEV